MTASRILSWLPFEAMTASTHSSAARIRARSSAGTRGRSGPFSADVHVLPASIGTPQRGQRAGVLRDLVDSHVVPFCPSYLQGAQPCQSTVTETSQSM